MPDGRDTDLYWAVKKGQDFVGEARQQELNWKYTAQSRGIWNLWRLIYCQVLGIDPNTGDYNTTQQLKFAGEQAQYALFRIQLTRGFIQQRNMLALGDRLSFTAVATNNDVASLAQVGIATEAIEYVLTEAGLEPQGAQGLETLGFFGASHLHLRWNYEGGDFVDVTEQATDPSGNPATLPVLDELGNQVLQPNPETGEPVPATKPIMTTVKRKSGAPVIRQRYPWQVVVDSYIEQDHPWAIVKEPISKQELAGQFPEKAQAIRALSGLDYDCGDDALFAWGRNSATTDMVVLRHFYHKACKAVPGGRYVGYVGDVILWDLPCPLEDGIPVEPMIAGRYFGTAFGYAESGDLLSLQQVLNELASQVVTQAQQFGNPNIFKEDGVDFDPQRFVQGGNIFDLPPGKNPPVVMQYTEMPKIAQYMFDFVLQRMQEISGGNSVTRGQPEHNITSGSFAVLLLNIAEKYQSQYQAAYDGAVVGIANKAFEMVRRNAPNGFAAEIGGIGNEPYMEYFSSAQLQGIRRIKIQRQNPVMNTLMGRKEIFDATKDLPKDQRSDALELLLNSNTDSFAENDQSAALRIRKENELMLAGKPALVQVTDDPILHCRKHRMQLDKLLTQDPPEDPQELAAYNTSVNLLINHITEHAVTWAQTPPPILAALGLPMPPNIQAILDAQGAQQAPPPPSKQGGAKLPAGKDSDMPNPPSPPQLPPGAMTDQAAQV